MRLGNLLNKIFRKRKQKDVESRVITEDIYRSIEHQTAEEKRFQLVQKKIIGEQGKKGQTKAELVKTRNKYTVIGAFLIGGVVLASILSIIYFRIVNSAFKESRVGITIIGKEFVRVGDNLQYDVEVENKNRIKLNNVVIYLNLPDNFILQENHFIVDKNLSGAKIVIGDLNAFSKKKYTIKVSVGYTNNAQSFIKAFAKYQPKNVSSYFQKNAIKNIHLAPAEIDIITHSVDTVSSGEIIQLDVVVKNNGENLQNALILEAKYPTNWKFQQSAPDSLDRGQKWVIKPLNNGEEYKIKIFGRLVGSVDTVKKITLTLKLENQSNILTKVDKTFKIVPSKIFLQNTVKRTKVFPGDFLECKTFFKNNSTTPLRNLVLITHVPGKYIDPAQINSKYGFYDSRKSIIIWKAADIKQLSNLQAGQEGEVTFSLKLADKIPFKSEDDKNPFLRIYSEIESLDIDSPVFENKKIISSRIRIPINSVVNIIGEGNFISTDNDENNKALIVDKKTIFKISFAVKNTTNTLRNVKLTADLPAGVSWEKYIFPKGDNLKFNKRSNQLEWKIGVMEAGVGYVFPSEKAEFLINVTPSANQINHNIDLLNNINIVAEDVFTGQKVHYKTNKLSSDMIKNLEDGKVILKKTE